MTTIAGAAPTSLNRRVLGAGLLAVSGLASTVMTTAAQLPTVCPFRICTGHACPGCGMTRSIGRAVRGDLAGSWNMHPLGIVIGVQLAALVALVSWRPAGERATILTRWRWLVALDVVLLLAVWIVRWRYDLLGPVVS